MKKFKTMISFLLVLEKVLVGPHKHVQLWVFFLLRLKTFRMRCLWCEYFLIYSKLSIERGNLLFISLWSS